MALDVTFDLDRLRVPTAPAVLRPPASATPATVPPARRSRPRPNPLPRHQPGEHFLKGPIPWTWLTLAMRQPGKALHVANAIWQRAGMARSRTIKLSLSSLDAHGVSRPAAVRGLAALEAAGLVTVVRKNGKAPEITLCEALHVGSPEGHMTSRQAENESEEIQQMETSNTNAPGRFGATVIVKGDDAIEMEASDALRP